MNILEDFEELKPIVQEKWLDFYETNSILIDEFKLMSDKSPSMVQYSSDDILLILIALVPELSKKMTPISIFNSQVGGSFPSSAVWLRFFEIPQEKEKIRELLAERKKNRQEGKLFPPSPLDDIRKMALESKNSIN